MSLLFLVYSYGLAQGADWLSQKIKSQLLLFCVLTTESGWHSYNIDQVPNSSWAKFWSWKAHTHRMRFGNATRFSGFQKSRNLLLGKFYWELYNISTAGLVYFSYLPKFSIVHRFISFWIFFRIASGVCRPKQLSKVEIWVEQLQSCSK